MHGQRRVHWPRSVARACLSWSGRCHYLDKLLRYLTTSPQARSRQRGGFSFRYELPVARDPDKISTSYVESLRGFGHGGESREKRACARDLRTCADPENLSCRP